MKQQGVRLEWIEVPASVRSSVEAVLGSEVVLAQNQAGGFSPGVAARCQLRDGRRCFIKCVSPSQNPLSPAMHRREAKVAALLPASLDAPRLLQVVDDGEWVTLVFEEVDGAPPAQPWTLDGLASTFRALDDLVEAATPCPVPDLPSFAQQHEASFTGFRRFASGESSAANLDEWTKHNLPLLAELESEWQEAAAGDSLVHSDVRADNLLVRPDGTMVLVDWPHACTGADWLDKLCMLPSAALDGGPTPDVVEQRLDPFGGVERDRIDRVLVALAGYFIHQGLQPDPIGLPTVRAFQRAQGDVARRWLAGRLQLTGPSAG